MAKRDALDPRELIREAFRIEGINAEECRSIFLDWALGVPVGEDPRQVILQLLERYADEPDDHPMKEVLRAGLEDDITPRRRGGWRARRD